MAQLVDHRGLPIRSGVLKKPVAAPTAWVRQPWRESTGTLTPQRLGRILRAAIDGNAEAYLTLAEEMEEQNLHYRSVLDTRKRAVAGLKPVVEAYSDEARDVELADAVRDLARRAGFRRMLKDCMDAVGKGYSVVELVWQTGERWMPEYYWRDPRSFTYDWETGQELRLLDDAAPADGLTFPAYKFITHEPHQKSGLQIRAGLAFAAAFASMCERYTTNDWMDFADGYGMPIRKGTYGPSASEPEIDILRRAVRDIAADGAAVFPDSMKLEFEQVSKETGSATFFQNLAEFWHRLISKLVLGQVRTADQQAAGLATASETSEMDVVRADIQTDDVAELSETLNRDLVIPYINLNYGEQQNYPRLSLQLPNRRNLQLLVTALQALVPLGLRVQQSEIRDAFGLADPDAGAEVLQPPLTPALQRALNRARPLNTSPEPKRLHELMRPVLEPILGAAGDADSYEAFLAMLDDVELDSSELHSDLANELVAAWFEGYERQS